LYEKKNQVLNYNVQKTFAIIGKINYNYIVKKVFYLNKLKVMKLQQIITIVLLFSFSFGTSFAYTQKESDAAKYLAEREIIKKQDNIENYKLDLTITRMETMKIIAKLSQKLVENKCDGIFPDVDKNGWGCKYIEFAYRENLIAKNKFFRPNDLITKTESIKLILKAKWIEKTRITKNWQEDYMITAFEKEIIEEKYSDFNASALRGWIFATATSVVKKEEAKKEIEKIKKLKKISNEAL